MKIPSTANLLMQGLRYKGTMGQYDERQQLDGETATTLDRMISGGLQQFREFDNQEGIDENPAPGQMRIHQDGVTMEVEFTGTVEQGTFTAQGSGAAPYENVVTLLERDSSKTTALQLAFTPDGILQDAMATVLSRTSPADSFTETYHRN